MKCPKCGKQNPRNAKFCGYCQYKLKKILGFNKTHCTVNIAFILVGCLIIGLIVIARNTMDHQRIYVEPTQEEETIPSQTIIDETIPEPTHIHSWKEATCKLPQKCATCGETYGIALGHKWIEPTCLLPETCAICEEEYGTALGHQWNISTESKPTTCTECGQTIGAAFNTINNEKYYFDKSGIMQTGWIEHEGAKYLFGEDGKMLTGLQNYKKNTYYFDKNGKMQTGWVEFSNLKCLFADDGKFRYSKETNINTANNLDHIYFKNEKGGEAYSYYKELKNPIYDCMSMSIRLEITKNTVGSGDGKWQVHIRDLDGKWHKAGKFTVDGGIGTFSVTFSKPKAFDAYVCTLYSAREWKGEFKQDLVEVQHSSIDVNMVLIEADQSAEDSSPSSPNDFWPNELAKIFAAIQEDGN